MFCETDAISTKSVRATNAATRFHRTSIVRSTLAAATLRELGSAEGDHVALVAGNRPGFLTAWFALMEPGAVALRAWRGSVHERPGT